MEKMKRNAGCEVLVEMALCGVNGQENSVRHPTLKQLAETDRTGN